MQQNTAKKCGRSRKKKLQRLFRKYSKTHMRKP